MKNVVHKVYPKNDENEKLRLNSFSSEGPRNTQNYTATSFVHERQKECLNNIFFGAFFSPERGIDITFLHSSRRLRRRGFGGQERPLGGCDSAGIGLTGSGGGRDGGVVTTWPLRLMSALSAHQCCLHSSSHCHDAHNDTDNDPDDTGFVTVALDVINICKMCRD